MYDIKKVNQVKMTTNYSYFKKLEGNRYINSLHYKRLLKSISENSLQIPIIINENYEIIDGQTRFQAWKELNKPIYFIINQGYGLKEIQIANSNIKVWNQNDFLNSYCELGYEDYLLFKKFKDRYGFDNRSSITMLQGEMRHDAYKQFTDGLFKISSYKEACDIANNAEKLKTFYKGYKRRAFVQAMIHLLNHENFDINILLRKLKYQSSKLVDCTRTKTYLILLQEIYNFQSRKKVNLIFND